MYELIDASELGFPELERPLMIVKYEEAFGRRRMVFSLTLHDRNQAMEILETLNGESDAA